MVWFWFGLFRSHLRVLIIAGLALPSAMVGIDYSQKVPLMFDVVVVEQPDGNISWRKVTGFVGGSYTFGDGSSVSITKPEGGPIGTVVVNDSDRRLRIIRVTYGSKPRLPGPGGRDEVAVIDPRKDGRHARTRRTLRSRKRRPAPVDDVCFQLRYVGLAGLVVVTDGHGQARVIPDLSEYDSLRSGGRRKCWFQRTGTFKDTRPKERRPQGKAPLRRSACVAVERESTVVSMTVGINRHSPDDIQIRGNRTTAPSPRELCSHCSHPMT